MKTPRQNTLELTEHSASYREEQLLCLLREIDRIWDAAGTIPDEKLDDIERLAFALDDKGAHSRVLSARSINAMRSGHLDRARAFAQQAADLAIQQPDAASRAHALGRLGAAELALGHLAEGMDALESALRYADVIDDPVLQASLLAQLASVPGQLGSSRAAEDLQRASVQTLRCAAARNTSAVLALAHAEANLAIQLLSIARTRTERRTRTVLREAAAFAAASIRSATPLPDRALREAAQAPTWDARAQAFLALGRLRAAAACVRRARALATVRRWPAHRIARATTLAAIALKLSRAKRAARALRAVEPIALGINLTSDLRERWLRLAIQTDKAIGDPQRALDRA